METYEQTLASLFRYHLEGKMEFGWTHETVEDIVVEAVRLLKKDDTFWECIDYALDNAIENVTGVDDEY